MSYDRAVCPFCGRSISLSPKGRVFAAHDAKETLCYGSYLTVERATEDAIPDEKLIETIEDALGDRAAREAFAILRRRHEREIEELRW